MKKCVNVLLLCLFFGATLPCSRAYGDWTIPSDITLTSSIENPSGSTLTIDAFVQVYNQTLVLNDAGAEVLSYGNFVNGTGGLLDSNGNLYNEAGAALTNTAGGSIEFSGVSAHLGNYGFLDNFGTLSNTTQALADNYGSLVNENGGLIGDSAYFYNQAEATLTNTAGGLIVILDSGAFGNVGFLDNFGTFSVSSSASGGSVINYGGFVNESGGVINDMWNFTNAYGATLTNTAGGSIEISGSSGTFGNYGVLYNFGTLSGSAGTQILTGGDDSALFNESGGLIETAGGFDNGAAAFIQNSAGGLIEISGNSGNFANNGSLENFGTLSNTAGAATDNYESIVNESGGLVYNSGYFYNGGILFNAAGGLIESSGVSANLQNYAFLDNYGTLSSSAQGLAVNDFSFINENGGLIDNASFFVNFADASLTNTAGGLILNSGNSSNFNFENIGYLANFGTLSNTANALVENAGGYIGYGGALVGGEIVNESGGLIYTMGNFNNGTWASLTNAAGGLIENGGILANGGSFDNAGTLSGTVGSAIENADGFLAGC